MRDNLPPVSKFTKTSPSKIEVLTSSKTICLLNSAFSAEFPYPQQRVNEFVDKITHFNLLSSRLA